MSEAWLKIVSDTQENPIDTKLTSERILDGIPKGGLALEVGAGVGRLMRVLALHFDYVWGVDMSDDMVAMSKDFLKDYPNCTVKLGDGYRLPVASNAFNFVYSYITFQHMPDLNCVRSNVEEIARTLKSGGLCRVQTLKGTPFRGEFGKGGFHGCWFENEEDFRTEFLRCGFETTVHVEPLWGFYEVIWLTGKKV